MVTKELARGTLPESSAHQEDKERFGRTEKRGRRAILEIVGSRKKLSQRRIPQKRIAKPLVIEEGGR